MEQEKVKYLIDMIYMQIIKSYCGILPLVVHLSFAMILYSILCSFNTSKTNLQSTNSVILSSVI